MDIGRVEGDWSASRDGLAADERAVEPLIALLHSRDKEMRASAAAALGQYGGAPAVSALSEAATRDADDEVRRCATEALGRAGGPPAVPALLKALADRSEAVRDAAVAALEGVGPPAVPSLIAALGHRGLMTRRGAALALGRIADERAVAPLIGALQGSEFEDVACRWAAAEALGEVAARRPTPLLRDALPVLRRLPDVGPYRRVLRQIEAATVGVRHLPVPAAAPPPSAASLPVPALTPPPDPDGLPVPSSPGPGQSVKIREGAFWRASLRRLLRLWTGRGA